jgi:hypothetical protein
MVTVGPGTVEESNADGRCESARLLHVMLFGSFPDVVVTCTPEPEPDPGATELDLG